jgi:hypothetical protein
VSGHTIGVRTKVVGCASMAGPYKVQCCSKPESRPGLRGSNFRCTFRSGKRLLKAGIRSGKSDSEEVSATVSERRMSVELYSG